MPSDPPLVPRTGSSFAFDGLVLKERELSCFGTLPPEYYTEYRFSARPIPRVTVIAHLPIATPPAQVLLGKNDEIRLVAYMTFLNRMRTNPEYRSTSQTEITWARGEATYSSFSYKKAQLLFELKKAATEASRRGQQVSTLAILPRGYTSDDPANHLALQELEKVPGYREVSNHFNVDVVRLQQDSHGMALTASLRPKRKTCWISWSGIAR